MNVSLRRACSGARSMPSCFASPSHQLRKGQFSNHLRAFQTAFNRPQKQPRYFPSGQEQQQESNQQTAREELWKNFKRQENSKSTLLMAILAANSAVFIAWQYDKLPRNYYHNPTTREIHKWMDFMADNFIRSSDNIRKGYWWVIITSAFSHKNLIHFGFNMMAFYSFGQLIVHAMPQVSPLAFGALCLGSILSASAVATYHTEAIGDSRGGLGASGMVSGVLAFVTCAYPRLPVQILGFIPCPMWANTLLFFAIDAGIMGSGIWSPIGHDAHIGGSVFGALFFFALRRQFRPLRL